MCLGIFQHNLSKVVDDRNNDSIVLCKLGSHTISGCRSRVTGVGPPELPSRRMPIVLGTFTSSSRKLVDLSYRALLCRDA